MTEIEEFRSLGISTAGLGSDLPVPAQNALVAIVAAVAPVHTQTTAPNLIPLGPSRPL